MTRLREAIQRVRRSKIGLLRRFAPRNDGTAPPRMHACCSVAIRLTGRGSEIPFDRQNLVCAGAAAGTLEPTRRRPIVGDNSGKRRAYKLAAPEASQGVRPELKPGIGDRKKTQKQRRVLTFESPFQDWRAAKI